MGRRTQPPVNSLFEQAAYDLKTGKPVLVYDADGREEETDLVLWSGAATPRNIRQLREDAGGLVCVTIAPEHHLKLGLPYLADVLSGMSARYPILGLLAPNDIRYDATKSSFGLTVNARKTYTGIPDLDRAATIRELSQFLAGLDAVSPTAAQASFGKTFRSPGHVHLLNGAPGGLAKRQGHTELSLELARQCGLVPSTVLCEMLDGTTGKALGKKDAMAYAQQHGLVFMTGQDIVAQWQAHSVPTSAS